MRILFLARHDSGDNDDEGAIAHALRELGHEVVCVHENIRHRRGPALGTIDADLCLFLKHPTVSEIIETAERMPCAFWFFDMVEPIDGDTSLAGRSEHRRWWFDDVLPHCVAGFCTDGDWVAKDTSGKLVHLTQGFDERKATCQGEPILTMPPIVFCGMVNHGRRRASHVARLKQRWGKSFGVYGDVGGSRLRLHGQQLADLFASTRIVIAPDGPGTDRYQSNRVYLTLGLGGFLLHPYSQVIAAQYEPARELVFYRDRDGCDELIAHYLKHPEERRRLQQAGREATLARNLYRHRVAELLEIVEGRL